MNRTDCTASTLLAVLCFIDSGVTPRIAYDRDDLADALSEKLRDAVGTRGGSQSASITFGEDEEELRRQFVEVCRNIAGIFDNVVAVNRNLVSA